MKNVFWNYLLFVLLVVISENVTAQSWVTCPECHGNKTTVEKCKNCRNGAVYCEACNYSGKIKTRCPGCNGSGYTFKTVKKICPDCNGQRFFKKNSPVKCSNCGGRGKVSMGRNVGGHMYNCRKCGGSGQVDNYINAACRKCGATGYFGTETVKERHHCDNGYVTKDCSICKGRGCYACPVCKGYSEIQTSCKRCHGNGSIYVYSE